MPTFEVETADEIFEIEAPSEEAARFIVEGELSKREGAVNEVKGYVGDVMSQFGASEGENRAKIQAQRDIRARDELAPWKQGALGIYDTANLMAKGGAGAVGINLDKAAALARSTVGLGTYEDELAKQQRLTEAAQNRVGPAGGLLAEGAGGLMTGLGIARKVGTLPGLARTMTGVGGAATRAGLAGVENFGYGAASAYANDQDVLTGGAVGTAFGSGAALLGKGLYAAGRGLGRAAEPLFRPSQTGVRKVGEALERDIASGTAYSDDFMRQMQAEGAPLVTADVGGVATRRLASQAARGSDEAAALAARTNRTGGQGVRIKDAFDRATGLDVENTNVLEGLDDLSRNSRRPLYDAAYADPNAASIWDTELENLTKHPEVRQAIREANDAAARDAAENGTPVVQNPFVENADGSLGMRPGVTPSLPFWDIVQRRLGALSKKAHTTGEGDIGRSVTAIRRRLNERLDAAVPAFGDARGASFRIFQAEDAYEFGTKFAKGQIPRDAVASQMRRLNPQDRQIIQLAWVKENMRGMDVTGNSQDLVKRFDKPAFRQQMDVLFGEGGTDRFMGTVALEHVMQRTKQAAANNSAIRDALINGGGGAALGAMLGFGLTGEMTGAGIAGAIGGIAGRAVVPKLAARANERMLTSAAEILFSPDPAQRQRALQMAQDNRQFRDAMFEIADRIGLLARSGAAVGYSRAGEGEGSGTSP